MSTKGFPNLPTDTSPSMIAFLSRVLEVLGTLLGTRGSKMDKAVTYQDLVDLGLIEEDDV